jgi:hypothetical protein
MIGQGPACLWSPSGGATSLAGWRWGYLGEPTGQGWTQVGELVLALVLSAAA